MSWNLAFESEVWMIMLGAVAISIIRNNRHNFSLFHCNVSVLFSKLFQAIYPGPTVTDPAGTTDPLNAAGTTDPANPAGTTDPANPAATTKSPSGSSDKNETPFINGGPKLILSSMILIRGVCEFKGWLGSTTFGTTWKRAETGNCFWNHFWTQVVTTNAYSSTQLLHQITRISENGTFKIV